MNHKVILSFFLSFFLSIVTLAIGWLLIRDVTKPSCVEAQTCVPIVNIGLGSPISQDANHGDSVPKFLAPADGKTLCFLTKITVSDVDEHNDAAGCHVFISADTWELQALTANDHAHARCIAQCITW